ncbi:MAG: isocitrate lyase/PEP mutase family protein [Acidobacteria bacterium]|nr:isocitrate lyase/PEP mutase family protein [Acidobacteriota bacterium]
MSEQPNRREFIQGAGMVAATGLISGAPPLGAQTSSPAASPPAMGGRFRALLQKREPFENVAVFDVFTARLVEVLGFPSLYLGSSGVAEFHGIPDWELHSPADTIEYCAQIMANVDLPAVIDLDNLGEPLVVYRTVKELERQGAGAVHLCDGVQSAGPGATQLVSTSVMVDRIHAAVDARSDLVISVRCQGRNLESLERTFERANAYAEAGAETVWFLPITFDELEQAAKVVKIPLMGQIFGDTPPGQAKKSGITVAVYASFVQNIAQSAVYDALMELKTTGALAKSSRGQRLGNTIPADVRARVIRSADFTERAKRYQGSR